uniref:Uncharacterized protein n=1 Tax=Strongyloides papillosus TaxID=174720 RepID=A0A0N5BGQ7_STREA
MANKIMLLFGLLLKIFFLNVIQSKLYEYKPGELSEAASNVQEYSVSLNDLINSNIKNNIIKRDIPGVGKQEYLVGRSMSSQSGQRGHSSLVPSIAKMSLQSRGQKRSARRGVSRRHGRGVRGLQRSRRVRSSKKRISSRGRLSDKSVSISKRRQNQSPPGDDGFEEIECDGEILEVGPEVVSEDC